MKLSQDQLVCPRVQRSSSACLWHGHAQALCARRSQRKCVYPSRSLQSRRLSERKPRTSKHSVREFPGFPSQNDSGLLNTLAGTPGLKDQSAPDNVDYGAIVDSLASMSMSARTRRSSRPQSASSHSSRSCRSEDHSSPLQRPSPARNMHQADFMRSRDGAIMPSTTGAVRSSLSTSGKAGGNNSAGGPRSFHSSRSHADCVASGSHVEKWLLKCRR